MLLTKTPQNANADKNLARIGERLRVLHYLDPINLRSEKKRFLRRWLNGSVYNPRFRYRKIDIDLEGISRELRRLPIDTGNAMGKILKKKRGRLLSRTALLSERGTSRFLYMGHKLYGRPSTTLVSRAVKILEKLKNKTHDHHARTVSSRRAAQIFKQALARHRIDWHVTEKRDLAAKAGVSTNKSVLVVRKGAWFSRKEVKRLIAHEIETHIFRIENGRLQPYSIFAQGFPGPETTEEGLAVWAEFRRVRNDYERRRIIAARTVGVERALHRSFFEVFEHLIGFNLHPDSAWDICVRVKRGLRDTSRLGAFTKDHHYFKGYLEIKQYLKKGGDLRDLYVGKINVASVERLSRLSAVIPPKFLPWYLKDRKGSHARHYSRSTNP